MMKEINKYSNPQTVYKNAKRIYGNDVEIQLSSNPKKKYMIYIMKNGFILEIILNIKMKKEEKDF